MISATLLGTIAIPHNNDPWTTSVATSFEYVESWPGTLADSGYPDTFTGFLTPSDATPLESFERDGSATPPGDPPSDWPA